MPYWPSKLHAQLRTEAELPALAVASGCNVFIFRNLRPYYKFVIPAEEAHPEEKKIWSVATDTE
eukprot:scaffold21689_cov19-Prasinocladus_malaysianus.AAC.1